MFAVVLKLKEKIAASVEIASEDADSAHGRDDVRAETPTATATQQRLEPLPRRKKKCQEEDRLMSDIATRGEQSTAFQASLGDAGSPPQKKTCFIVLHCVHVQASLDRCLMCYFCFMHRNNIMHVCSDAISHLNVFS